MMNTSSWEATDKQIPMTGLAWELQNDPLGKVLTEYCAAFDAVIMTTQSQLRKPGSVDIYLRNTMMLEAAECAMTVINSFWEGCHKR